MIYREADLDAIDDRWTLDLGLGLGLFSDVAIDARLPLITQQSGIGIGGGLAAVSAGDLRLRGKWRLLERELNRPFGLALQGAIYVPTGDREGFSSDGLVRFEPRVVADVALGRVLLMANLGYQVRPKRVVAEYRHDDAVRWGLAARMPLSHGFDMEGALFGEHLMFPADVDGVSAWNRFGHPVEALGGFGWNFRGMRASIAAGAGVTRGVGAPAYRVVFGLGYAPFGQEDVLAGRTVIARDFDGDGFAGDADRCPYEPETFDGFEDHDGCPDLDDDGDGIADLVDLCPTQPGIAAKAGCPAIDTDGDGLDDAADACPTLPGSRDADGCPEPRDSEQWRSRFAVMTAGECEPDDAECTPSTRDVEEPFPEAVFFPTGQSRFKPDEHPLLERLANKMLEDRSIVMLYVEGHTDSIGDAEFNQELSRSRAQTVYDVLIRRGVEAQRLEVRPYGESRPIASNDTAQGRTRNRRVAFQMVVRHRGRDLEVQNVSSRVEIPTLTMADFDFDRRKLVGFRPPRFVEGTLLRAPDGWRCSLGSEAPRAELTLLTVGPPVVQGMRYPGWSSLQRLLCRHGRDTVAFDIEVEIPPFGVRGVFADAVQLTTQRPTHVDLRFAGRTIPLEVDAAGYRVDQVAVSADVLRLRLLADAAQPEARSVKLGVGDRVLLNVPLLEPVDGLDIEPLPTQRRFIEIGGGATALVAGQMFASPGQLGTTALPALRFTARAIATNWFSVGGVVDVGGLFGPDPILFTPSFGGEAVFHLPTQLFRPFVSTGVQAFFPGLDAARPAWDNAVGIDWEPAVGAGLRASFRATVITDDGTIVWLPGGFLGTFGTF